MCPDYKFFLPYRKFFLGLSHLTGLYAIKALYARNMLIVHVR